MVYNVNYDYCDIQDLARVRNASVFCDSHTVLTRFTAFVFAEYLETNKSGLII